MVRIELSATSCELNTFLLCRFCGARNFDGQTDGLKADQFENFEFLSWGSNHSFTCAKLAHELFAHNPFKCHERIEVIMASELPHSPSLTHHLYCPFISR